MRADSSSHSLSLSLTQTLGSLCPLCPLSPLLSGLWTWNLTESVGARDVHAIGIRSKTKLTARVLAQAENLIVIGCFCIGTNQVDLDYAAEHGIAVFNSPFSNSRSVAELVIAEIISLARQLGDRSNEMHQGIWNKVSNGCWEVRGKTIGTLERRADTFQRD